MVLRVGNNFVVFLVRLVAVHRHLQRVHVGGLALYHGGEMSPGRTHLVGVLVVHRVLAGEVPAVLGQHFREDNVSLVPEDAVVGVTDDVEAEESVGDVKVEDKVERLL